MPPRAPRERGFQSPLGVRHGIGALTCGEGDFGAHPAAADPAAPAGFLVRGLGGQPPRRGQPAEGEVVGGEAEEGVGSRAGGVEAVRILLGVEGGGFREGLAVERAGLAVAAELAPVRGERAGGERGGHRVAAAPEGIEERRGGGVPALGAEDDGGEQPFPRAPGPAHDGGIGQRIAPERGGPEGGFVHGSFLVGGTDKS